MKKLLVIAAILFLSVPSFAQIQSASLQAAGLTCSLCSNAIFKALKALPSVQNVDADVEKSEFHITFKPLANVVLDDVKIAVERAGFSVASLTVTANFPEPVDVYSDAHITFLGNTYHFVNVPKQTLTGVHTFTVVDKNFVPAKTFKKYAGLTTMPCIHTGMMAACCSKEFSGKAQRIYHVTL